MSCIACVHATLVAGSSLRMAETTDSNPITTQSSKVLLNIPRKQDSSVHTSCHSNIAPTFNSDGEPVVSHHHHQNGELTHVIDAESSSSDSEGEGSSEEESSEEEEEEEGEVSEEQELHNAGVEIDLNALGPSEVGVVPLVLLTEVCVYTSLLEGQSFLLPNSHFLNVTNFAFLNPKLCLFWPLLPICPSF